MEAEVSLHLVHALAVGLATIGFLKDSAHHVIVNVVAVLWVCPLVAESR